MVRGHQVPHRGRPEMRRQAPGVHPALRHPRGVDDGLRAQPQDRARRDRGHGARAVLRDLREGCTVKGEDTLVSGRVLTTAGKPIPNATLDIWQAKADGIYDVQTGGEFELRGRVKVNAKGEFAFKSYKPKFYSVPDDGPVGDLIRATGNHHMCPAHMHAIVSAPGYQPVIT